MTRRSNKLRTGSKDAGHLETAALTLEAIQAIIAKEMGKAQREWQLHKQIVETIQKVESNVDQRLLALEAKMDKTEQNMQQMKEKAQGLEPVQNQQQQPMWQLW